MAIFGIEVERNENSIRFFSDTRERLKNNNLVKNPFVGDIKPIVIHYNKMVLLFSMKPIYPNFSFIGWLGLVVMLYFIGLSFWLLIPTFVGLLGLFWSSAFFFQMARLGLRKAKYKGKIRKISPRRIIEIAIFKRY